MTTLQQKVSVFKLAKANLFDGLNVESLPIGHTTKYMSYLDYYNVPQIIILYFYLRDMHLANQRKNDFMAYKQRYNNLTPTKLLTRNIVNNIRFLGMNLCIKYMVIASFKLVGSDIMTQNKIDNANYFVLLSYIFINLADIVIYYMQENEYDISQNQLIQYYLKIKKMSYLFKTSFMSLTISIWICIRYYEYLYKAFIWIKGKVVQ